MYGEGNQETPWKDSVPICHVYREYSGRNAALTKKDAMNPCTGSRFPSSTSRGLGKSERILQIRKKASQPIKNTDTIPCSMSPHSRTTSSRWLQDFPVCSALTPDSERPAILSGTDLYPCFCAAFPPSSGVSQPTIGRPFYISRFPLRGTLRSSKGCMRSQVGMILNAELTWRPSAGSPQSGWRNPKFSTNPGRK